MDKVHLQNLLALADIAIKTGTIAAEHLSAAGSCILAGRELFGLMKEHQVLAISDRKPPAGAAPSDAAPTTPTAKQVKMPMGKKAKQ